jgi:hypothetical protein
MRCVFCDMYQLFVGWTILFNLLSSIWASCEIGVLLDWLTVEIQLTTFSLFTDLLTPNMPEIRWVISKMKQLYGQRDYLPIVCLFCNLRASKE